METLLLGLFYISTLYAFIPGLISRLFGFRVFRRGVSKQHFALTFDDGPDPTYTPQLLDLLKRYNAKATFFVVGANAEKYPQLIQRMHEEGHLIGIHNYVHKSNWFMWPATVKKHIQKTTKIIRDTTGMTTHYYRPPWGIVNLFDFAKRNETQIVLWSAMFGDWRQRIGADRLTARMLKKLRGGEVFLLHDCGTTLGANEDAPMQMIIALERVLQEAERRNLSSITIDELIHLSQGAKQVDQGNAVHTTTRATATIAPASVSTSSPAKMSKQHVLPTLSLTKKCIVSLWLAWEKLFHFLFRLKTTEGDNPFFYFRTRVYHGNTIMMADDIPLVNGDTVLELHFDNKKLFQIGMNSRSAIQTAIQMIRNVEKTLPELAQYVANNPDLHDVKALYGVTMINRGTEHLGFTVADLPDGWFKKSSKVYLKFLMSVIHPAGNARLKQSSSRELDPKMLVMPISHLIDRYSEGDSHHRFHDRKYKNNQENQEDEDTAESEVVLWGLSNQHAKI